LAPPSGKFRFGILNVLGYIVHEFFEGVGATKTKIAAAVAVGIDVGDGVFAKFLGVRLDPFGRAEQAGFFAIPRTKDQRALGLPTLLHKLAERASFFEHRGLAGQRIFGAIYPAIVMVAANDPFIGVNRTGNFRDDIVERLERSPVRFHYQVNFPGTRTDVIADTEAAAPRLRRYGALQRGEKRLGIAVGNRQYGNLGDRLGILKLQALRVLRRAHSRCQRIAGIERHIRDAAALHAIFRAVGTLGENIALGEAVFMRVGKNQAADGAMFGGDFWFNAAPGTVVARDDDGALHGDAHAFELLVISGNAEIYVDEPGRHVPVYRVGVVGRKLLGGLV